MLQFFALILQTGSTLLLLSVQEEVGPYTFRMVRLKTAVQWVDGGAAVRWLEYRYHLWEPSLSNGSLDDPITTLNLPLVGGCAVLSRAPPRCACGTLLPCPWPRPRSNHLVCLRQSTAVQARWSSWAPCPPGRAPGCWSCCWAGWSAWGTRGCRACSPRAQRASCCGATSEQGRGLGAGLKAGMLCSAGSGGAESLKRPETLQRRRVCRVGRPCRDPLLAKLAKFAPGVSPTFRLAWNMSSPAEAALDFPTQASTGGQRGSLLACGALRAPSRPLGATLGGLASSLGGVRPCPLRVPAMQACAT